MIKLENLQLSDSGKRIDYNYSFSSELNEYLENNELLYAHYDIDVSLIPESILVIPFLANLAPICWFLGCDIKVQSVDDVFLNSLKSIKKIFSKDYPEFSKNIDKSKIIATTTVKNNYNIDNNSMLFSGGVDAYATYFKHRDKSNLDLVTIKGADIAIDDDAQWNRLLEINKNESLLKNNKIFYVESNIRKFYTYKVDLLLKNLGWWGAVQHGLALNSLIAPLSFIKGYQTNYIASSYTDAINIKWGSTPELDNSIRWGKTDIVHDGYDLLRQEKVDFIVKKSEEFSHKFNLRVCYSLLNKQVNCSFCEKCLRTIIAILLNNANPNNFGFNCDSSIYDKIDREIKKGFLNKGTRYFWQEIYNKFETTKAYYYFESDQEIERYIAIKEILEVQLDKPLREVSKLKKLKFRIINIFPSLFNIYLKLRNLRK